MISENLWTSSASLQPKVTSCRSCSNAALISCSPSRTSALATYFNIWIYYTPKNEQRRPLNQLDTGCPTIEFSLCFACFLGFPCSYRGSFYHFSTAQETTIPKLTLLSLIKLQSKTWSNLDLDTILINLVCTKIIISKYSLPHILLCNLINFLRREESKVSFGIVVSWAVEKW